MPTACRAQNPESMLMFDELCVESLMNERMICLASIYFTCVFVLTQSRFNFRNLPGDVTWSRPMRNADPGVDSQSREEIRRRTTTLEEEDETVMMLRRETEGRMTEGRRHSDYNYQLDSMMTCSCENPPSLTSLSLALFPPSFLSGL